MFESLDNNLGGCMALFIMLVFTLWHLKPKLIFDEDENPNYLNLGNFKLNIFGISAIFIAIVVYYVFALFKYNY